MSNADTILFEDWVSEHPDVKEVWKSVKKDKNGRRPVDFDPKTISGYLGEGRDKLAFRVGKDVLKVPQFKPESSFISQVSALKKSLGLPGVEQLVAVSWRSEVIVTRFIEGTMPARLAADDLAEHYLNKVSVRKLERTLEAMQVAGTYVDGATNMIADGETVHVIDPVDDPGHGMIGFEEVASLIAQFEQDLRFGRRLKDRGDRESLLIWNRLIACRGLARARSK